MLDGVEAEALHAGLLDHPHSPINQVLAHIGVIVVDVTEHQVVEGSLLAVDILGPVLAVALNLEDGLLAVLVVPVDSSEVVVVPLHLAMHALAAREVEAGPAFNLVLRRQRRSAKDYRWARKRSLQAR